MMCAEDGLAHTAMLWHHGPAPDLESSEDWIVNPGRIDLLTDYVGWVPVPTHGPSEAVWHTAGQPIQFNLQISSIDVHISEAAS